MQKRFCVSMSGQTVTGEADQALKLKVRDAVGKEMGELLQDAKTAEESSRIAREHFPEIIHIAKEVIRGGL